MKQIRLTVPLRCVARVTRFNEVVGGAALHAFSKNLGHHRATLLVP